jgi:acetyl-CoA/propionyl-CoA carboxylase biotin carboxyl carrier protein
MPGTIVAVPVASGSHVAAGETIMTVEAMKMEHKLTAPVDGIVQHSAKPADLVKLGELLATIIPVDSTTSAEEAAS